jgi:hypothetical protein
MTDTKTVMKFLNDLAANECIVTYDLQAGVCEAKDGNTVVYKGIRKGASGEPWIVRCTNTERIKFA